MLLKPLLPNQEQTRVTWGQLYGGSISLALSEAATQSNAPLLVIVPSAELADRIEADLKFYLQASGLPVWHFPDWETLPYDVFSPHQDIVSERLATLYHLPDIKNGVVVVAAATLMQRLPPRAWLDGGTLLMDVGERVNIDELRRRMESGGYRCVSQVMEHGEFAIRGSLIDIFPMGASLPFRVDLFDDEIESIRSFDPETQLSKEKLSKIRMLPAREFPLHDEAIRGFRQRYRARFEGDPKKSLIYRDVSEGIAPAGIEYYLPLFFEQTETLIDYLPAQSVIAQITDCGGALDTAWEQAAARYEQRRHDIERPILKPADIFFSPREINDKFTRHQQIDIHGFELLPDKTSPDNKKNFATAQPPSLILNKRGDEPAESLMEFLETFTGRILFAAESAGRREHILELLRRRGVRPRVFDTWKDFLRHDDQVGICIAPLAEGVHLKEAGVSIVCEAQIFGDRAKQRQKRRAERDPNSIIRDLTDLSNGAPVVHEEHGVGRYRGLQTLEVSGVLTEFLTLEYAAGDKLYVPVSSLHLITRYTGTAPEHAPLHRLGSDQWQKAKRRAAEKARDAAAELLEIYARRAAREGNILKAEETEYLAFTDSFPFEETTDQKSAIEQVVTDLSVPKPMDRLVCGDVGFGKTEVALRAAFVAVQSGKQVAILVPTTLLAQQHYQTFLDRFADWPVKIEMLSRFRSQKQQQQIITDLGKGVLDIIIGTHGILSDKIKFKNLSLVIIDEEHRFGVRHKEKLKALRAEVDILTLTATPIPRTLNMSLAGIRDLSIITTPPVERLSVKTFVSEWNDALVYEACLREIKRGGQVYVVHNSVETIEKTAAKIAQLVPEANVRTAHGQMRERELEQVMLDFYHRRFNILICTTIIESGIDVPTANTIIINRADRFGLAQLHQLRGRVGRSHHRAYAYLIAPPRAVLTADAVKRLEAIESLEDLGAGFTLATHDLEIRGAGELLGDEQSGQIQEVGFTLYTELLERAVSAMKSGEIPDMDRPLEHGPEIDLRLAALLPEDYMPDVHMRLVLYKRIANAGSDDALRDLQVEMVDRFGLLPAPAKNLFRLASLRLMAAPMMIKKIEAGNKGGRIIFGTSPNINSAEIIKMIQQESQIYKLNGQDKLQFKVELEDSEKRYEFIETLLRRLLPEESAVRKTG